MNKHDRALFIVFALTAIIAMIGIIGSWQTDNRRLELEQFLAEQAVLQHKTNTASITEIELGMKKAQEMLTMTVTNNSERWYSLGFNPRVTNNIMIHTEADYMTTNHNVILIGMGARSSTDYELVIRFVDGSELRQALPRTNVALVHNLSVIPLEQ